jgi:hypoxanthine phosphoribosyltransferase
MRKSFDIFISYSQSDSSIANDLQSRIEARGLTCFMAEKNIKISERWEIQVINALKTSEQILLLITPKSINSKWVMLESGAAWVLQKKLIPLLMHTNIDDLPEPIKNFQSRNIEHSLQIDALISELVDLKPHGVVRGKNVVPEILTFHDVLVELGESAKRMIENKDIPDLLIGSGRGGAICAGILGANFGHKDLKLIDCHFRWDGTERITEVDFSGLNRKSLIGKKVLVVESSRQSGETYRKIHYKLKTLGTESVKSFALVWRTGAPSKPDYYAFHLDFIPKNPWDLGLMYFPHSHFVDVQR